MNFNKDQHWLAKRADQEDQHLISLGGLISRMDPERLMDMPAATRIEITGIAFSRLLNVARRERHLSLEELANKANVDLVEVVNIEMGRARRPTPRTVYQLASFLKLPLKKLMALAGLVEIKDMRLQEASLKFLARSEPAKDLSVAETAALEEFVSALDKSETASGQD